MLSSEQRIRTTLLPWTRYINFQTIVQTWSRNPIFQSPFLTTILEQLSLSSAAIHGCGCGHWTAQIRRLHRRRNCNAGHAWRWNYHRTRRPRTQTRSKPAASDTHKEQNPEKRKEKMRTRRVCLHQKFETKWRKGIQCERCLWYSSHRSIPLLTYKYQAPHAQTKQDPSASRVLKLLWI